MLRCRISSHRELFSFTYHGSQAVQPFQVVQKFGCIRQSQFITRKSLAWNQEPSSKDYQQISVSFTKLVN